MALIHDLHDLSGNKSQSFMSRNEIKITTKLLNCVHVHHPVIFTLIMSCLDHNFIFRKQPMRDKSLTEEKNSFFFFSETISSRLGSRWRSFSHHINNSLSLKCDVLINEHSHPCLPSCCISDFMCCFLSSPLHLFGTSFVGN